MGEHTKDLTEAFSKELNGFLKIGKDEDGDWCVWGNFGLRREGQAFIDAVAKATKDQGNR